MAFNVSGLGTWINENKQDLISAAILESNTIQSVTLMPGVKYKEQIKYLDGDALIQAAACGTPTSSGTTTLTDKDVEVKSLMVYEETCPEDFNKTSLQLSMKPGWNTEIPFEQQYADIKVKKLQKSIEEMIWSSTGSGTTKTDGWIYLFANDDDVKYNEINNVTGVTFDWLATGNTASDYMSQVYKMIAELPDAIQSMTDLTLFVSPAIARKMSQSFVIAGNYHIDFSGNDGNSSWVFPGTNVLVKPTNGLVNQTVGVLTPASNLIVATDLQNEWEKFNLWYSEDDLNVKFIQQFKIGTSYYFGEYVVVSTAS